jgi:hypothetical protein
VQEKSLEAEIVETVLRDLDGRKGFDNFWHDIHPNIKKEIRKELRKKVLKILEKRCSPE